MVNNEKKNFRENLAANIRKYRAINKWSQDELAEAADTSQQYICLIENAKVKKPSLELAYKIANALNVTLNDLTCEP